MRRKNRYDKQKDLEQAFAQNKQVSNEKNDKILTQYDLVEMSGMLYDLKEHDQQHTPPPNYNIQTTNQIPNDLHKAQQAVHQAHQQLLMEKQQLEQALYDLHRVQQRVKQCQGKVQQAQLNVQSAQAMTNAIISTMN